MNNLVTWLKLKGSSKHCHQTMITVFKQNTPEDTIDYCHDLAQRSQRRFEQTKYWKNELLLQNTWLDHWAWSHSAAANELTYIIPQFIKIQLKAS